MTRLDALKELAAKVEAGKWWADVGIAHAACAKADLHHGRLCTSAFHGSLDASKALQGAVLPGWALDQFGQRAGGWIAVLGCRDGKTPQPAPQAMIRDNPARAWLLAILRAMIAQEEGA